MSGDGRKSNNLPTEGDLRLWKAELSGLEAEEAKMKERHAAEERALKAKINGFRKLVSAGEAFVGLDLNIEQPVNRSADKTPARAVSRKAPLRDKSWTATIEKIALRADRGLEYSELREEIGKTHLAAKLKKSDKGFYGAIGKLAERDAIFKHNGRVFSPGAYKRFMADVADGRVQDINYSAHFGRGSPNKTAIKEILSQCPDGATTGEIVDTLLNNPPAHLDVSKNKNSLYNLLSNMHRDDELIKRGDRYYLSTAQPDGSTEGDLKDAGIIPLHANMVRK